MKRIFSLLLGATLICGQAAATDIRSIETEVTLLRNGHAVVLQRWDVTVDSGTEWYIPIGNLGKRHVSDLSVYENDVKFADDGRGWDSGRSLAEKTHRSGIVDKGDGVELCWGQGEYGDHVYEILYVIDNLVQKSSDGKDAQFIWQFLNDEWKAKPQKVTLKIINGVDSTRTWVAGEGGNMGAWVFGCEADYNIKNNTLVVESTEPFKYESSLIVMMRFDPDLFTPGVTDRRTFAQLQEQAFKGSDYALSDKKEKQEKTEKNIRSFFRWLLALLIGGPLALGSFHSLKRYIMKKTGKRYEKSIFGRDQIKEWSRDVPMGGNLLAAFCLLHEGDKLTSTEKLFSNLVGAYFLRWVEKGLVIPERDARKPAQVNLKFANREARYNDTEDFFEKIIYQAAREASGRNLVLEGNEFMYWSQSHYMRVGKWPSDALDYGKDYWGPLSPEKRCEVVAFRNFLEDFTLSSERDIPEVGLWKEYLVFAQLFGVADKISKALDTLYPDISEKYAAQTHMLDAATRAQIFRSVRHTSSSLLSAANDEKTSREFRSSSTRSSGGGGHSSSHGGGGFSGGGHGGGSR